ncbi:MAG: hypothetical protein BIFFINMI_02788 [Phycisphaerae bacterium]|nr:hypothetical protein [Phycisphaerae bacterium]
MKSIGTWQFRQIDIFAVVIGVAVTAAFYWLGVNPVLSMRDQRTAQLQDLYAQQTNLGQSERRLAHIKQELAGVRKSLDALPVHLEPATSLNTRISRLTELVSESRLKIDGIRPAEPAYGADYGSVPIVIDGSGSYTDWTRLLHELARQYPDTAIETFQLSRTADDMSSTVSFHLDLTWYVSLPTDRPAGQGAPGGV